MALTRKFLSALGIEAEKIDEIIEAHTDTVNALKKERDEYKDSHEKLPDVQKELDELKEASDTSKSYKKKYEDELAAKEKLQNDFDSYKAGVEEKETTAKKSDAYRKLLKEAGVSEKRLDSVMKVSHFNDIELDENGSVKDAEKLTDGIKKEWADFIVEKRVQGVPVAHPIVNKQGEKKVSRATELAAKYHANLYGESQKGE